MRCYSHLSDDEREQIGLAKALGHSIGTIAHAIGRSKSTISRELCRNRLPSGRYSPLHAAGAYQLRRRREARLQHAPDIIRRVVAEGIPRDVLINVNFPDCAPDEVKRIAVAPQGRRRQERLHIDERRDGRGNPYYWITYARLSAVKAAPDGTDLAALDEHCIAVTPLKLDMTDEPYMTKLAGLFE